MRAGDWCRNDPLSVVTADSSQTLSCLRGHEPCGLARRPDHRLGLLASGVRLLAFPCPFLAVIVRSERAVRLFVRRPAVSLLDRLAESAEKADHRHRATSDLFNEPAQETSPLGDVAVLEFGKQFLEPRQLLVAQGLSVLEVDLHVNGGAVVVPPLFSFASGDQLLKRKALGGEFLGLLRSLACGLRNLLLERRQDDLCRNRMAVAQIQLRIESKLRPEAIALVVGVVAVAGRVSRGAKHAGLLGRHERLDHSLLHETCDPEASLVASPGVKFGGIGNALRRV